MKLMILGSMILLGGCSYERRLKMLEWRADFLWREIQFERCNRRYDQCVLHRGERCFQRYQACVIKTYTPKEAGK